VRSVFAAKNSPGCVCGRGCAPDPVGRAYTSTLLQTPSGLGRGPPPPHSLPLDGFGVWILDAFSDSTLGVFNGSTVSTRWPGTNYYNSVPMHETWQLSLLYRRLLIGPNCCCSLIYNCILKLAFFADFYPICVFSVCRI